MQLVPQNILVLSLLLLLIVLGSVLLILPPVPISLIFRRHRAYVVDIVTVFQPRPRALEMVYLCDKNASAFAKRYSHLLIGTRAVGGCILLVAFVLLATTTPIPLTVPTTTDGWPAGSASNFPLEEAWTFQADRVLSRPPFYTNGMVLAETISYGALWWSKVKYYAFNPTTGTVRWHREMDVAFMLGRDNWASAGERLIVAGGGGQIEGRPVRVVGLDTNTGETAWTGSSPGTPGDVVIVDGTVVVASHRGMRSPMIS